MESAIVMPLFFVAVILLISLMDLVRVQTAITVSLNESAKTLGTIAYAAEKYTDSSPVGTVSKAVAVAYARSQLPEEDRVTVSFSGSSYSGHVIDLKATVVYEFPAAFGSVKSTSFVCRARVHAWTGYDASEESVTAAGSSEMVYVTESGTVYHTHRDCTYLRVTAYITTLSQISSKRNASGAKYSPCSYCNPGSTDSTVYYTKYGTTYHSSSSCSALKRTVRLVKKSSVSDRKLCSRCAAKGSG